MTPMEQMLMQRQQGLPAQMETPQPTSTPEFASAAQNWPQMAPELPDMLATFETQQKLYSGLAKNYKQYGVDESMVISIGKALAEQQLKQIMLMLGKGALQPSAVQSTPNVPKPTPPRTE